MIKDILVHVEPADGAEGRWRCAAGLAQRFDAQLIGLYVVPSDPWPLHAMPEDAGATVTAKLEDWPQRNPFVEEAESVQRRFAELTSELALKTHWHQIDGPLDATVRKFAAACDLLVLGADPEVPTPGRAPAGFAAHMVLGSGRPVLVVDEEETASATLGRRPLVAWNGSREAVRAVHDALPILAGAEQVLVLTVGEPEGGALPPDLDLCRHLGRHGVEVELIAEPHGDPSTRVTELVEERGCDLVVMGGYGHTRLRELVFGGVTRTLFRRPPVPLLASH